MQDSKNYSAIDELNIMKRAVNYNRWIWDTIVKHLGENILEIGAGIGTFTEFLKLKNNVYVTDSSDNCLEYLKAKYKINTIIVEYLDIESINNIAIWKERSIDSIVCLNVLEHISDDNAALFNMNALLRFDGNLIVMVPAFMWAYGTVDVVDGHFRRYSKVDIFSKMKMAKFEVTDVFYFNSLGLLGWYFTNKIIKRQSTSLNAVLLFDSIIVPLLKVLERNIKPVFGQSIICIGRKR